MKLNLNKRKLISIPMLAIIPGIMIVASCGSIGVVSKASGVESRLINANSKDKFYSVTRKTGELDYVVRPWNNQPHHFLKKYSLNHKMQAYCMDHDAKGPTAYGVNSYTLTNIKVDKKLLYAMEANTGFSDENKQFYVTNTVILGLCGDAEWVFTSGVDRSGAGVLNKIKSIYKIAKSGEGKTTRDVKTSLNPSKIKFSKQGNNYESDWITLNIHHPEGLSFKARLEESTVKLKDAPNNTKIIKSDGSEASGGKLGKVTKFKLRIPASELNNKVIGVSVSSKFEVGVAKQYKPDSSSKLQPMLLRATEYINVDSSGATSDQIVQVGDIKIIKKGPNGEVLKNADFQIKSSNGTSVTSVQSTDKDGVTVFKNIPVGKYIIVEKEAPSGYIKGENQEVTVNVNSTETKTFVNQRAKGNYKVTKIGETNNRLQGATFQLESDSKVVAGPIVTDSNGEAIFKNVPTGVYNLVEVSAPTGYIVDSNQNNTAITINKDVTSEKTISNKLIRGNISVKKLDADDKNIALSGAKFDLYNSSNNIVASAITDASGVATFKNVTYGKYKIKESKSPAGYLIDERVLDVDIDKEGEEEKMSFSNERIRDFSLSGYNVKDSSKQIIGTLQKDKEYTFNVEMSSKFPGMTLPSNAVLKTHTIGKLKYVIAVNDGTVNQDISTITTSNVEGTIIEKDEISNIKIKDLSEVWKQITFKTPNDYTYGEIVFVVELEADKDSNPENDRIVIKLPIINERKDEISITNMEIYPNASGDALVGNDVNVKVDVEANSLKTYNAESKITIVGPPGFGTQTLSRPIYGTSLEEPGSVYYKFKPTVAGKYTVTSEVNIPSSTDKSTSKSITVVHPSQPKTYASATNRTKSMYDTDSYIKTYVKVKKRDRTKIGVKTCDEHCQKYENGTKACPSHKEWVWGEWYDAFVPVKSTKMSGIEEKFNISEIKFRSKTTEGAIKRYPQYIDSEGYVSLLNEESAKYAQVKAGYGFDVKIKSEYSNNLPQIFNKAYTNNTVPKNSSWSQYKTLGDSGKKVPYVYSDIIGGDKDVSVDSQVSSYAGVVSVAVPSLSDLIIESPNQLYFKLPDPSNEYYMVNEGYGASFTDPKIKQSLSMTKSTGPQITSDLYSEEKIFELKNSKEKSGNKRGYYISKEVSDGPKTLSFYNRYVGYGINKNTRLHDMKNVSITVSGGRYDDIKDSE